MAFETTPQVLYTYPVLHEEPCFNRFIVLSYIEHLVPCVLYSPHGGSHAEHLPLSVFGMA